jgi:ATP synthase protein I
VTEENNLDVNQNTSTNKQTMADYYQLKQQLLVFTLALTGIIFISVWVLYSLNIALNYLLGAIAGLVYLRMLAKDVESLGAENRRVSPKRLALVAVLIIVALKWELLEILPVLLGFFSYKIAIVIYAVKTSLTTVQKTAS